MTKQVLAPSYPINIYIAGDINDARRLCRKWCADRGACVTVTPTDYVYTGGAEDGVIIGLINYPRFPKEPAELKARAVELANYLVAGMCQLSASVECPDETIWITNRPEDNK